MTIEISSWAIPCDAGTGAKYVGWFARQYEDVIDRDGHVREETVRDWNHANAIINRLTFDGSAIRSDEPPGGSTRIMSVYINVLKTRRGTSQYRCAYKRHAFDGAYNVAADATMDVYRTVKRILRHAQKEL